MTEETPKPESKPAADTQSTRRLKYGVNVIIAVTVAVTLTALLNYMVYENRDDIRVSWDLTATRRYSLSEQTEQLLDNLDKKVRIVTVFEDPIDQIKESWQNTIDVADLYGRFSDKVTVEHIERVRQVTQYDLFRAELHDRFEDELKPVNAAIDQTVANLEKYDEQSGDLFTALVEALTEEKISREYAEQIGAVTLEFRRYDSNKGSQRKMVETQREEPMPFYSGMIRDLQQDVAIRRRVAMMSQYLKAESADSGISVKAQEKVLRIVESMEKLVPLVSDLAIAEVSSPEEYEQLRRDVESRYPVVLLTDEVIRVVQLEEMIRLSEQQEEGAEVPNLEFLGEEILTGTLVSMTFDKSPMVVFVFSGGSDPLGPSGSWEMRYFQVTERLRNMNFDVQSWSAAPQMGNPQMGIPPRNDPPPVPETGQKAIWVLLPDFSSSDPNRAQMGNIARERAAKHLESRLKSGDSALVMFSISPQASRGGIDPVREIVTDYGITPQTDRLIMQEVQINEEQTTVRTNFPINQWNIDSPITKAIRGLRGILAESSPLVIDDEAGVTPLLSLKEPRLWSLTDFTSSDEKTYDKETAEEEFVIAAAAEKGDVRMIVMGNPVFASDRITTNASRGLERQYNGLTFRGYAAAYPGNSEFFVNSVYWLADLEQLIASSARAQDSRRIDSIEDGTLSGLRWAAWVGMPAVVLVMGMTVWFIRRRG